MTPTSSSKRELDDLLRAMTAKRDPRAASRLVELYAHRLYGLAYRVLGDSEAAEDTVQDTFLALLSGKASYRGRGQPEAFLFRVTTHIAIDCIKKAELQKSYGHKRAKLVNSQDRSSTADPGQTIDRKEALKQLESLVRDLSPEANAALALRFEHDYTVRDIAALLAISRSTVSRLLISSLEKLRSGLSKRGLGALAVGATIEESLRSAELPSPSSGFVERIKSGLRAVPPALPPGRAPFPAGAGGSIWSSWAPYGGAAVLIAVVAIGWTQFDRWFGNDVPVIIATPPDRSAPPLARVPNRVRETVLRSSSRASEAGPKDPDFIEATPTTSSLAVVVRWAQDDQPAAGVHARVISLENANAASYDPFIYAHIAVTDREGRFEITGLPPAKTRVMLDRGGDAEAVLSAGGLTELTIRVREGVLVRGRVVDARGEPIENAEIWLSDYGNREKGLVVTQSDRGGRFQIRSVGSGRYLAARAAAYAPSELANAGEAEVLLELGENSSALRGQVLAPDGQPLAAAVVWIRDSSSDRPLPAVRLETDKDGSFVAAGLRAGEATVGVRYPGAAPWEKTVHLPRDSEATVAVRLAAGITLTGRVSDSFGVALPGTVIYCGRSYGDFTARSVLSDQDGHYVLDDIPDGEVTVHAKNRGVGGSSITLRGVPGSTARWDPVLEAGRVITGLVRDHQGYPLAGWRVMERHLDGLRHGMSSVETDADGRFTFANCKDLSYALGIYEPGSRLPLEVHEDVRLVDGEIQVVVQAEQRSTGSITGIVLDEEGQPDTRAEVVIACLRISEFNLARPQKPDGRFEFDRVPPGSYGLAVQKDGKRVVTSGQIEVMANQRLDLGTIQVGKGPFIEGTISRQDGEALVDRGYCVVVRDPAGEQIDMEIFDRGDSFRIGPFARGHYTLIVNHGDLTSFELPIELPGDLPDGGARIRVAVQQNALAVLNLQVPKNARPPKFVQVTVSKDGAVFSDRRWQANREGEPFRYGMRLPLGKYSVKARSNTGLSARGEFTVERLGVVSDDIVLLLN